MNLSSFFKLLFTSILLFFNLITIHSQNNDSRLNLKDSTQTHILLLKNGKRLHGKIISIQNENILFLSKRKKVESTFKLSEIKKIKVEKDGDGSRKKYDQPLQYSSYLFFTNTAFALRNKEKNYRTFMGASILRTRGLGSGIEFSFGYSLPFMLNASLKFSGPISKKSRLAFKTTFLTSPIFLIDSEESTFIFSNTLVSTFGNHDRFLNIGLTNQWFKAGDFFFRSDTKIFNTLSIGGGIRIAERWQFIIEERAVGSIDGLVYFDLIPSFGFNYSTDKFKLSFGFHSVDEVGFNHFPILDFTEDDLISFFPNFLKNIPFFSYTKSF